MPYVQLVAFAHSHGRVWVGGHEDGRRGGVPRDGQPHSAGGFPRTANHPPQGGFPRMALAFFGQGVFPEEDTFWGIP